MKMVLVIEVVRKDHAVSSFLGAALILSSRLLVKGGRFLSFFFIASEILRCLINVDKKAYLLSCKFQIFCNLLNKIGEVAACTQGKIKLMNRKDRIYLRKWWN